MVVELRNFLKLTQNRKSLYDIGALHGVFSFAFTSSTGGHSFAFEPSPPAAKVLRDVQSLNPGLKVDHQPLAIGRQTGELLMRMEWQHLVALPQGETPDNCLRVEVQSLDQFASAHSPPDCVKIDVEGYEHEVLLGASQTLKKHHPLLFLEIHPVQLAANRTSVDQLINHLKSLGYELLDADLRPFVLSPSTAKQQEIFNLICQ